MGCVFQACVAGCFSSGFQLISISSPQNPSRPQEVPHIRTLWFPTLRLFPNPRSRFNLRILALFFPATHSSEDDPLVRAGAVVGQLSCPFAAGLSPPGVADFSDPPPFLAPQVFSTIPPPILVPVLIRRVARLFRHQPRLPSLPFGGDGTFPCN